MKTVILMGSLNRGGTETLILDVLRHSVLSGLDLIVVYRKDGVLFKEFEGTGIRMYKARPHHRLDVCYLFRLRKILRQESVNIVHAQQPVDALFAILGNTWSTRKTVLSMHGYDYGYSRFTRKLLNFILKNTDKTIFVSHAQKTWYERKYTLKKKNKLTVVHNGVCFNKFRNYDHSSLRDELGLNKSQLLLGSVGNFNAVRDQMSICRFLKLLKEEGQDFSFVFAGGKSESEPWFLSDCVSYCKENKLTPFVHFLGSRDDVPNILSQLDAFIYASDHDTFGIAVIEALYMGVPVFVNDWEVMVEITDHGQHGNLYKSGNEHDLYKQFIHFLEKRDEYVKLADSDVHWTEEKYSIETHLANLNAVYTETLNW